MANNEYANSSVFTHVKLEMFGSCLRYIAVLSRICAVVVVTVVECSMQYYPVVYDL